MAITKGSVDKPSDHQGYGVTPLDGDATDSMQDQLADLQNLHSNEAAMTEDGAKHAKKHAKPVGGLHSAEALSKHLESRHAPIFTGYAKSQGN